MNAGQFQTHLADTAVGNTSSRIQIADVRYELLAVFLLQSAQSVFLQKRTFPVDRAKHCSILHIYPCKKPQHQSQYALLFSHIGIGFIIDKKPPAFAAGVGAFRRDTSEIVIEINSVGLHHRVSYLFCAILPDILPAPLSVFHQNCQRILLNSEA